MLSSVLLASVLASVIVSLETIEDPAPPAPPAPSAWIGIQMDATAREADDPDDAADLDERPGVNVVAVMEPSPADEAGIRESDRIVAVDGLPVSTPAELIARVRTFEPGAWVPLEIRRGRQTVDLRLRLAARPEGNLNRRKGWIGVRAIDLPPALREHFGAPKTAGALVYDVAPASPAYDAGIRIGDVIFQVGERPLVAAGTVEILATMAGVGNKVEVRLMRYGGQIVTEPRVERAPKEEPKTPRNDE